jgi:ketosteroid isomerase-like protein
MNQDIVNVIKAYEKSLNASDAGAVLALYGEDPIFMPEYAAALSGRDAVKAGYDHVFNTLKLNVTFTVHEVVEIGRLRLCPNDVRGKYGNSGQENDGERRQQ